MGKIRNKSGDDLALAKKDAVVEVPDAEVYGYTASANWEPVDKAATTAHNKGEKDEAEAVAAERAARGGYVEPEAVEEPAPADD